ncbi:hypothetical protein LguiA_036580 [Lonicera macranthoides]
MKKCEVGFCPLTKETRELEWRRDRESAYRLGSGASDNRRVICGKQREQSTADRPTDEMPCLNLFTNVSLNSIDTSSILFEATSTLTKLIGKLEAYVMIMLKGSVPMVFGGIE